jgi:hypothetical protein
MTKDEGLRLALEALEYMNVTAERYVDKQIPENAITAIKEALANEALDKMAENARELGLDYEPEQEPVAWRAKNTYENQEGWFYAEWHPDGLTPQVAELLYTTPLQRTWVGLTDDNNGFELGLASCTFERHDPQSFIDGARWAEAKLKAKNT